MANLSPISLSGTLSTVSGDSSMAALESEDQGFVLELQGALEQQSGATATRAQALDARSGSPDQSSQDERDQQNLPSNAWVMVNPSANFAGVPWVGQLEVPAVETNPVSTEAVAPIGAGLAQMAAASAISMGSPGGMEAIASTVSSSPLGSPELQSSTTAVPVSMPEALAQEAASLGQTLDQVSGEASGSIVRAGSDATSSATVGVTQDSASQIKASAALLQGDRVTGFEAIPSTGAVSAPALQTPPENAGVGAITYQAYESVSQSDASTNSLPLALATATAARDTSDSNNIQSPAGAQPVRVAEVNQVSPVVARVQQIEATDLTQPAVELESVVSKATDVGASALQAAAVPMSSVLQASVLTGHPVEGTTAPAQELASPALSSNETNSGATMVVGQTGQDMTPSATAVQSLAVPADEGVAPPSAKSLATGVEGPASKVMVTSRHAVMDLQASTTTTTSPREPLSPPVLVQAAADMAAAGVVQEPRAQGLDRGQDGVSQEADGSQTDATPSGDTSPAFNLFASPAQTLKEGAESIDASRAGAVGSGAWSRLRGARSLECIRSPVRRSRTWFAAPSDSCSSACSSPGADSSLADFFPRSTA